MSLKVLIVINGLGPGGAERSLAEMLPRLAARAVHLLIACFYHWREGFEAEVASQGFDIRFLEGANFPLRLRDLRRLLAAERPALIHTTLFEADVAGRLAAVGTGIPVLTSLVNTAYDPARLGDPHVTRYRLAAVRHIDGWTARHLTAHFHAVSQTVKHSAVEALGIPEQRVTVIERGRDPSRLGEPGLERRLRVRRKLGLSPDEPVAVTVGRQEYQKGHRYLLEAMAELSRRRTKLRLLLVGRAGNLSSQLQSQAKAYGLADRVRFLGHREDVPDLLAAADLFVFPSLYEGLGGAVIEAMALGLPIVASDIPVMREVLEVDRNALLVPSASPRALADALEDLLDHPAKARSFGARGRAIFAERFTLDRGVERMTELYERLTDNPEPG
jgi:glycosyltransferase involved in cell wall biosynthesis